MNLYLRLRRDLKESLENQLSIKGDSKSIKSLNEVDLNVIKNLEAQLNLMKKERDNAIQMWQNSLLIITQLEQELKVGSKLFRY